METADKPRAALISDFAGFPIQVFKVAVGSVGLSPSHNTNWDCLRTLDKRTHTHWQLSCDQSNQWSLTSWQPFWSQGRRSATTKNHVATTCDLIDEFRRF